MKRLIFFIFTSVFLCASSGMFAELSITLTKPSVNFTTTNEGTYGDQVDELNAAFAATATDAFASAFTAFEDDLRTQLAPFSEQKKLAQGFGNAGAYSGQAATFQGFQGYSLIAFTAGGMIGGQLPTMDPSQLETVFDKVSKEGDLSAGIGVAGPVFNIGINAQKVFGLIGLGKTFKNIYLNVHFGGGNFSSDTLSNTASNIQDLDLSLSSSNFGLGVNYQLVKSIGLLGGFFRWRGINLGTGLTVNKTSFTASLDLDEIKEDFFETTGTEPGDVTVTASMTMKPKLTMNTKANTVTIPFEATTAFQALWFFNVNAGAGFDLVFGSSTVVLTADSPIKVAVNIQEEIPIEATSTDGSAVVEANTKASPSIARARIMSGVGFNFGPVKVDMPVYYYLNSGFAAGLTLGFIW